MSIKEGLTRHPFRRQMYIYLSNIDYNLYLKPMDAANMSPFVRNRIGSVGSYIMFYE
jgi:hypothetical protein